MKIRSESFTAEIPVTFYGVAISPEFQKRLPNDGTAVFPWFLRFTGTSKAALAKIALECTNGVRDELRKDQVKMFEVNIDEVPWDE
jgi:hypothetical protein